MPRDSKSDKSQNVNPGLRGVHDLKIPIQELEVLTCLGQMSREFGLDRTVGLITITRSDGYYQPNPRVGIFGNTLKGWKNIPNSKKMVVGGVRTSSTKFRQELSKPPCFVAVSGDHDGGSRLRWAGRGKYGGSNGNGLPSIGGRR
ncbi:hypothetical protein L3X38_025733 [Prunus dulcis]|uniref:Uncharacterized protein n=1 Tax=Prunus dulcis TaxID=3755 RepID=A0AAD4W291_PRUDU|nr:hypothetical protein L3X38_025733 [Prunus dulcis]